MITPEQIEGFLKLGPTGMLVFALLAIHRRWVYPGWAYDELHNRYLKIEERLEQSENDRSQLIEHQAAMIRHYQQKGASA